MAEQSCCALEQYKNKAKIQDSALRNFLKECFHYSDFARLIEKGEKAMMEAGEKAMIEAGEKAMIEAALLFELELKQEGLQEEIIEGMTVGIFEVKTATLRRLLSRNCSIEEIAFITDLSEEQVRTIIHALVKKDESTY